MISNNRSRQRTALRRFYDDILPIFITITPCRRNPVFNEAGNAKTFLEILYLLRQEKRLILSAFALMPDHVHLLFKPIWPENLSTIQHKLKRRSARVINWQNGRKGAFWDARSFDRIVRTEEQLIKTVEYIHWNPVKAGLTELPEEYLYSSANAQWPTDLNDFLSSTRF
ncbi:MAG: REP-associated tyrosine transposase [Limisphaerales bacterium]